MKHQSGLAQSERKCGLVNSVWKSCGYTQMENQESLVHAYTNERRILCAGSWIQSPESVALCHTKDAVHPFAEAKTNVVEDIWSARWLDAWLANCVAERVCACEHVLQDCWSACWQDPG